MTAIDSVTEKKKKRKASVGERNQVTGKFVPGFSDASHQTELERMSE
jgi:hypothetical protein